MPKSNTTAVRDGNAIQRDLGTNAIRVVSASDAIGEAQSAVQRAEQAIEKAKQAHAEAVEEYHVCARGAKEAHQERKALKVELNSWIDKQK